MTSSINRRQFLQDSALLAAGSSLGMASPSLFAGGSSPAEGSSLAKGSLAFNEYRQYDALGLADLVRKGEASPEQLLEIAIARSEAVNPKVNTIVAKHYQLAREAIKQGLPDGPFKGVPYLLKDLGIDMQGTVTSHGSAFFKDAVSDHDSTLVARYRQAGLVIFGKTHSPEFGGTPSSESALFGSTHNPWNLALSAGGSSGGAAAAVAAGIIPAAHASDGGGSIRIPASACGLFGMKPTRGRVPMGPDIYESRNGLSVQHAVSRSVRDCAALLDISQGSELGDAYSSPHRERPYIDELSRPVGKLRIALMTKPLLPIPVDPECAMAAEKVAKLCEGLGHQIDIAAPALDVEALYHALGTSSNVLVAAKVAAQEAKLGRKVQAQDLERITWQNRVAGGKVTAVEYSKVRNILHNASRSLAQFMQNYDVVLSPTMAIQPQQLGVLSLNQKYEDFMMVAAAGSAFTSLHNMTGQPAMSVPLHWTKEQVPVGVMFAGRFGDEATLYRLAAQLEKASPWFDRVAPV